MINSRISMKRDMDLIREMLLAIEAHEHGFAPPLEIEGHTQEEIGYHSVLLGEAGLAEVVDMTTTQDKSPDAAIIRLTWAGHEFLDSARKDETWNQAKDIIKGIGGASIAIWAAVLTSIIKQQLGLSG